MRARFGKSLTCTLLAIYASISLIGEGLHSLVPHGHHLGDHVVHCIAEDPDHCECCHHHDHHDHEESQERALTSGGGTVDCHACQICEFLYQTAGQAPSIAATPDLHPLVAELPCAVKGIYSAAILGLHAARGPPQLA
jgi:hypothetical protein